MERKNHLYPRYDNHYLTDNSGRIYLRLDCELNKNMKNIEEQIAQSVKLVNDTAITSYQLGYEAGKKEADHYWKEIIDGYITKMEEILKKSN